MYSTISEATQRTVWNACLELEKLELGVDAQTQIDIIKDIVKAPVDKTYVTGWHG